MDSQYESSIDAIAQHRVLQPIIKDRKRHDSQFKAESAIHHRITVPLTGDDDVLTVESN